MTKASKETAKHFRSQHPSEETSSSLKRQVGDAKATSAFSSWWTEGLHWQKQQCHSSLIAAVFSITVSRSTIPSSTQEDLQLWEVPQNAVVLAKQR